jgi:hypothetical protein
MYGFKDMSLKRIVESFSDLLSFLSIKLGYEITNQIILDRLRECTHMITFVKYMFELCF